eukprot:CAMPEP_0173225126 /NCGR_PEP_ID=MMETSP1142-20121109/4716_1 /TAXON_ID=483371 /ORGANISM="non described non described, Strain CCMP2298" /LENGTH=31 /DNA_ID= /DNA_START= /DNA_END= /DNA_ORIENTATION=
MAVLKVGVSAAMWAAMRAAPSAETTAVLWAD